MPLASWNGLLTKAGTPTDGVFQVETATVVGTVTTTGLCNVVVTAAGMTGSPITVPVLVDDGTLQVETLTVLGAIGVAGAGDASVVLTSAAVTGSPITTAVAVANSDTASLVAGKVRTALGLDSNITDIFTISGSGANVVLTQKAPALADDPLLSLTIANGTCTGLTSASSVNSTVGGVADGANAIATKIRAALAANAVIADYFTVSGATDKVILTRTMSKANDTSLNIAIADDTSVGVTTAATSANTTAGVRGDYLCVPTGAVLTDTTNKILYVNSGTNHRPVWTEADPQ